MLYTKLTEDPIIFKAYKIQAEGAKGGLGTAPANTEFKVTFLSEDWFVIIKSDWLKNEYMIIDDVEIEEKTDSTIIGKNDEFTVKVTFDALGEKINKVCLSLNNDNVGIEYLGGDDQEPSAIEEIRSVIVLSAKEINGQIEAQIENGHYSLGELEIAFIKIRKKLEYLKHQYFENTGNGQLKISVTFYKTKSEANVKILHDGFNVITIEEIVDVLYQSIQR